MSVWQKQQQQVPLRACDLFSHGFLTKFTVPGVSYVEQSTPVRKQLVISICLAWRVVVIVIYEAHSQVRLSMTFP